MFITILKKVRQQILLLLVVTLVLLAAYVSAGRQFMPAISGYVPFFEQQIFEITGVPVSVESLTGSFQGFNPVIQVNALSFQLGNDSSSKLDPDRSALVFESANVIVDIPRSIWQRRWVLEEFSIDALEVDVEQTESGSWQLSGLNIAGGESVDLAAIYRSFLRVSRLDLRNVTINLLINDGGRVSLANGFATIQNLEQDHHLHIRANLEGNSQQLLFSLEVQGSNLEDVDGQLHLRMPPADYSQLFSGQKFGSVDIEQLVGGGDFWIRLRDGEVEAIVADASLDNVTLITQDAIDSLEPAVLNNISGLAAVRRGIDPEQWEILLSDVSVSWRDLAWDDFSAYVYFAPEQKIEARFDKLDLSLLAQFITASGLGSDSIRQQLEAFSPRGMLDNFSLFIPLSPESEEHTVLKTNLVNTDIASVNNSPAMWGINGYLEIDYDPRARLATGLAEIESEQFRINIPSVFVDTWEYDYVNGSLGFRLDLSQGRELKLVSGVIVAESEVVDGRVQFSSTLNRFDDGRRASSLELVVGALRFDAALKSVYLPNAPNVSDSIKTTMAWLDKAILDGEISNSGAIYRGSTLPGSSEHSKTFQSFYRVDNGEVSFSEEWPELSQLSALVLSDDGEIDIHVRSGSSMAMNMEAVSAEIRRNELDENWLEITGHVSGSTTRGLNYLQSIPVAAGLKNSLANWQADGNFAAEIEVRVPLNRSDSDAEVRLDIALNENRIYIPDFALEIERLTGPVIFDTKTGLERSELEGILFGQAASLELSSQMLDGIDSIIVDANGTVTPSALIQWPMQSAFVKDLLNKMGGQIEYSASLSLPQNSTLNPDLDPNSGAHLIVDSTLRGATLTLPHPFDKSAASEMPLHLDFKFGSSSQKIAGSLGAGLAFDIELVNNELNDGVIYVGKNSGQVENMIFPENNGLAIVGEMDRFKFEQWMEFIDDLTDSDSSTFAASSSLTGGDSEETSLGDSIAFVDIAMDVLELYGQELPEVDMRIDSNSDEKLWAISLSGDSVQGTLIVPFAQDSYIEMDLEHLILSGDEDEQVLEGGRELGAEGQERVDVLAQIDPRELPKMKFAVDEFSIGERAFGSWQFTLDPNDSGAEFTDLVFNFRGLRVGLDNVDPPVDEDDEREQADRGLAPVVPRFNWTFDGLRHHSNLIGEIYADNIADVLTANGYAASLESDRAMFVADVDWPGSPAFFAASGLSGRMDLEIEDGRFLQGGGSSGALKLISIINFDAIMRRLRFSDDLLRSGLAYDDITGEVDIKNGLVNIEDRLVISGPSSLYQITGEVDLANETIHGEMYVTVPLSDNIPWFGLLTGNLPLVVGAFLFDSIFGDQVDSLTSAVYTLEGPWEGLEPEFKQAFGSPDSPETVEQDEITAQ